ncbi:transposase [Metabacillus mangrovi]|uniref:transposase n=1 Tax=Metabacillus mangrovi TaxID=1491830 RepID=UPI0013917CC1|nr:transposase [Metabacillus mangrovi]
MKKYTEEMKKEVVQFYHDHPELGYLSVAREFGIPSDESVRRWVKKAQVEDREKSDKKAGEASPEKKTRRCLPSGWPQPRTALEEKALTDAENAYLKKLLELRKGDG